MRKNCPLIFSTVILCLLFFKLLSNYSDLFDRVEKSYNDRTSVNIIQGVSADRLCNTLQNYITNKKDADFTAKQLAYKINTENSSPKKKLKKLYDLQKRIWQVPANVIDSIGSPLFKERLKKSREELGMDNIFTKLNLNKIPVGNTSLGNGHGTINVDVKSEEAFSHFKGASVCPNVIVRLSEHYLDSLGNPSRRTICYCKTDNEGRVSFKGLSLQSSYSVIPVREGFEYGLPKGTTKGSVEKNAKKGILNFTFTQIEHKVRLLDDLTLKQIKDDNALTIRSPKEFKKLLAIYLVLFFSAWWGVYFYAQRKGRSINQEILSILMLLTGFCLLTMFSINDPLNDMLLGVNMAQGILVGVILIGVILNIDFVKFYQDRLRIGFDIPLECTRLIFKPKIIRSLTHTLSNENTSIFMKLGASLVILLCSPLLLLYIMPKGSGYLLTALLLTALLFPFGAEVEGMKVNLNLGITFQPSEIAKYLIIIFMAAYFCFNADNIMKYSEKGNTVLFGSKLKMLLSIIIGLGILMMLYIILGDMGPALVLAFTFIFLYSIIKSKIDLENLCEQGQLSRILTCDLAMLIYGVISFVAFICVGKVIGSMKIGCIAWFVIWVIIGVHRKQIFESPILFNLILTAFIFGGSLLSDSKISKLQSVGERLKSRNEMCTNTWGTLPIDGMAANAGENTQVAEGLWGLASGGFWGQGLGSGSPHFIPAFHTDMILESIGEQLGFFGIFAILLLLAILLRKTIILGYRASHPFAFYLCLGIAIVTAIQFIIISLGSTGIIPLTGVTVPFFSYGKVSMILNLAAFGIILSISRNNINDLHTTQGECLKAQNIAKYNYSISILSWIYCCLTLFIASIFFYYQFADRNHTLIRPVYVNNYNGVPVVDYNPRIKIITRKLHAGDIFDRHGVLLATSDTAKLSANKDIYKKYNLACNKKSRQLRYYPFGEHLYFMLGDFNTKLFFSSSRGYMAESKHLAELRGYDNVLRNANGEPIKINLYSNKYTPGRFYASIYSTTCKDLQIKDYSALIPYLKAGINSNKVARVNDRKQKILEINAIKPKDVQLTIDAELQTKLQQRIPKYVQKRRWNHLNSWNKLRISVVVMDAKNGDLLASANYPLPNYDTLKTNPDSYRDANQSTTWKAYTDMDLGLTYFSQPGSTAKVISALAGLHKMGTTASNVKYYVDAKEIIHNDNGREPSGIVTMQDAIVNSSNCYFINLVNEKDLYGDLANIYYTAGIRTELKTPYIFEYNPNSDRSEFINVIKDNRIHALQAYNEYIEIAKKDPSKRKKMNRGEWQWAWGQGSMDATPAAMARISSIVSNKGIMPITRYRLDEKTQKIPVVSSAEANLLNHYMKKEAAKHRLSANIGGKTGTPMRDFANVTKNDGWYICFIEGANISTAKVGKSQETYTAPLAIAVRMERLGSGGSGQAVSLTGSVVLDVLRELKYIN